MSNETERYEDAKPAATRLVGRQLGRAMNDLLVEVAEMVDATYPPSDNDASDEALANYDAMRHAISAIGHVLTVLPANQEFRRAVLSYVEQAWLLTDGDPAHDVVIGKCLKRASVDYKPATPASKARTGKAKAAPKVKP